MADRTKEAGYWLAFGWRNQLKLKLDYKKLKFDIGIWWVLRGSNPRPSPCKGDALPAELSTRFQPAIVNKVDFRCKQGHQILIIKVCLKRVTNHSPSITRVRIFVWAARLKTAVINTHQALSNALIRLSKAGILSEKRCLTVSPICSE